MNNSETDKELIVVGDVHGHYDGFIEILRHSGLIDKSFRWIGGKKILLQIGDIFDRGPKPRQVDFLLDDLQMQASAANGEVVRLIGNHELEMLMSNFLISGLDKAEAKIIRDKLKNQVLSYDWLAAYAYKKFLFTHAGVTHKLMKIFKLQLDALTPQNIADLINRVFREAIQHEFYRHPIFNISVHRKGPDKFGVIFWEDLEDLLASYSRSDVCQIVGHTQVDKIKINEEKNIIPIDVGMHRKLQYLHIVGDKLEIKTLT